MSVWNKLYQGIFRNQEVDSDNNSSGIDIIVNIYDTSSGVAEAATEIISLEMAGDPAIYESIDNDESKRTVIRATRATIALHSSDSIGLETFVDGGDSRFFGEIKTADFTILKGFVSIADVQEDFLPDPNVISLIITDGLGFLEDEDLTDEDGNAPTGVHNIWYYIRLALLKTGQSLPANIVFNIREKTAPFLNDADNQLGHFMVHQHLDARTFEGDNTGTRIKCAEVLRRLLFGCFITQFFGKWWIISVDEIQSADPYYIYQADVDGNIGNKVLQYPTKSIGATESMSWMNDGPLVSAERPLKKLNLKRLYEYFKEIPCNIDFERGTGSDPTGAADETIDYVIECWPYLREGSVPADLDSQPYPGSVGLLRKRFVYNYEVDRYLISQQAGGFRHYFKSEGIYCGLKEKFQIGINYRFSNDISAATINVMHIRLVGSDGNIYDLSRDTSDNQAWHQKLITDPVFDDTIQEDIPGPTDMREWHNFSFETLPAPVSGILYIRLMNDLASPVGRDFSALTITPKPLINGTYGKFTGEQDIIEQTGDVKALLEDNVYIGTGPDMNVKGALLKRGEDQELYSGTADFGNSGDIQISGDHRSTFQAGQQIVVTGSASNNIEGEILSVSYSVIGNLTTIITDQTTTLEAGATVVISLKTYVLSDRFYAAQVLPFGPFEDAQSKPYGENIAFNIWNQENRVMRKFDGDVDHLNTESDFAGFTYKFSLTDSNPNTGTRIFMLLHFSMNLFLCQWNAFLHEVHDPGIGKLYTGHSFKYLTQ